MTETKKHNVKSKTKRGDDGHSLQSGKSLFTTGDVVHPVFGVQLKRPDATTIPSHEQIAKRAYGIWQEKRNGTNQEEDCWLMAEVELQGDASKHRKEGIRQ